ncbi:galactose-1-epimerase [Altererythrobacter indicus]|uniref:Aldose 1-epimerase n=1 Tax=Altericroceibacterium indicum TaxID=374177 RepID=A0A845ACE7_9SPHN|nr:aldose epimerase family protein [Altericroceibacterium indicum]MXP27069.1 galactose-1-epimerase [Altericroceibacterium indicum]
MKTSAKLANVLMVTGAVLLQGCGVTAQESEPKAELFGTIGSGTKVEEVTLTNSSGMSVTLMTLGASVQSVKVPDANGKIDDVALGFDTPQEYIDKGNFYGASVGRFANRIAGGKFSLDGKTYQLDLNDGPNSLHGGKSGFDQHVWKIKEIKGGDTPSVTMTYRSPDGEGGYPGNADVTASYTLGKDNTLTVTYTATSDKPTIVNMSNHTYWNLSGLGAHQNALDGVLTIDASQYTPVNSTLIPTGELAPVDGTVFDFRKGKPIGQDVRDGREEQLRITKGFDHNFVIDGKSGTMRRMAHLRDPHSGRVMEVWSDSPGMQFYSGNFIDASFTGKNGTLYRQGDAVVFEPQLFPDAPNHPNFQSARLDPGQTYRNTIMFKFSTEAGK